MRPIQSRSRRRLSREDALDMVRVREARRAFREFHAQCFWFMPSDMKITLEDVPEVARGLPERAQQLIGYRASPALGWVSDRDPDNLLRAPGGAR